MRHGVNIKNGLEFDQDHGHGVIGWDLRDMGMGRVTEPPSQ